MKLDANGNLPLSDEGGFDEFLDWFSTGSQAINIVDLKRAIAEAVLDEFLRDINLWLTDEGIDISSSSTSAQIVVIPWDQVMLLGSRRLIKKKLEALIEREFDYDDDDDGEVDHACS
jgi:hypothetical protein